MRSLHVLGLAVWTSILPTVVTAAPCPPAPAVPRCSFVCVARFFTHPGSAGRAAAYSCCLSWRRFFRPETTDTPPHAPQWGASFFAPPPGAAGFGPTSSGLQIRTSAQGLAALQLLDHDRHCDPSANTVRTDDSEHLRAHPHPTSRTCDINILFRRTLYRHLAFRRKNSVRVSPPTFVGDPFTRRSPRRLTPPRRRPPRHGCPIQNTHPNRRVANGFFDSWVRSSTPVRSVFLTEHQLPDGSAFRTPNRLAIRYRVTVFPTRSIFCLRPTLLSHITKQPSFARRPPLISLLQMSRCKRQKSEHECSCPDFVT